MSDVLIIAEQIQTKIDLLEKMRDQIKSRATAKALSLSEYDRALAVSMIKLRSEGNPVTIVEKLAKGECYEERYNFELADGLYKSLISNMNCVQSELNGLQSINRHLSEH